MPNLKWTLEDDNLMSAKGYLDYYLSVDRNYSGYTLTYGLVTSTFGTQLEAIQYANMYDTKLTEGEN